MEDELLNLPSRQVLLEKLTKIQAEAKRLRILLRTGEQLEKVHDTLGKERVSNARKGKP